MPTDNLIVVRKFPAHTTVAQLRAYTQLLAATSNFRPDVVFVDYDSLLYCGDSALTANQHLADKRVYEDLREWAVADQLGVWVASQSTKTLAGKHAELGDMSGSACKPQIADLAISLNRSDEDVVNGRTVTKVLKGRHGAKLQTFTIPTDLDRMQFYIPQVTVAAESA